MSLPRGPEVLDWSKLAEGETVDLYYDEETRYDAVQVGTAINAGAATFWVDGRTQEFTKRSGHRVFRR